MSRSHNQDHFKVGGSAIESRSATRRSRQALSEQTAVLRSKASKKPKKARAKKEPTAARAPARKAAAARSQSQKLPEIAREAQAATSVPAAAMPNAAPAEVLSLRREHAARTPGIAPEATAEKKLPGLFGRAREAVSGLEGFARKSFEIAMDIATAPLTVARLLRRMRREEV